MITSQTLARTARKQRASGTILTVAEEQKSDDRINVSALGGESVSVCSALISQSHTRCQNRRQTSIHRQFLVLRASSTSIFQICTVAYQFQALNKTVRLIATTKY